MRPLRPLTHVLSLWHRSLLIGAGALLVLGLAVGLVTSRRMLDRMESVNDTYTVLAELSRAVSLVRDAESEQRGYIITGSPAYMGAFEAVREELREQMDHLVVLLADSPHQRARMDRLRSLTRERMAGLRQAAEERRMTGAGNMAQGIGTPLSVRLMTEIRRVEEEIATVERALLEEREQQMQHELEAAAITMILSGVLALGLAVQAFVLLQRALEALRRESQLLREKEKAESSDREKSEFLANMSHEIRTPMNAVIGFAELLGGVATTPKQRQYLESINASGKAMLSLINDILDLSKIEAGKLELINRPVSLRRLLEDIRNIFNQQAEARGVLLLVDVAEAVPPSLLIDPARLRQILFNVVGNALKFTSEGSVTVRVWSRLDRDDETRVTLHISVADTGIGIRPEHLETVFEPFRQVHASTDRRHGGTGLGLSITRRLTELLGGTVSLESEVGRGATFAFVFPGVQISPALPDEEKAPSPDEDLDSLRPSLILIADDVLLNRELLVGYFETTRHRLIHASNGAEAVKMARKHRPDLILMDVRMPELDGREALLEIKSLPELMHTPIVAVTASSMMQEELMLRQQFDGYVRKPLTKAVLFQELSRHLPSADATGPDQRAAAAPVSSGQADTPTDAWGELLNHLRKVEQDVWPQLVRSMGVRETDQFAHRLRERAEAAECRPVIEYAGQLQDQVEAFQIKAMEITLKRFPNMVAAVAERVEEHV